ncbi:ABC transporter substrate-binding protein [Kineococcus sp. TBRC 1896]|uniref:ABC transporter substrate-binding protein n=1 Tax=Kineococcus mangrovi TaxID=1660183 RepID=A0ABV4I864_9ACTN
MSSSSSTTRRTFLGLAAGSASMAALSACGGGSGSGGQGQTIEFWDMPWGTAAYNTAAQELTEAYVPTGDHLKAGYQIIQWNNFTQTFSSAIASNTGPAVSTGGGFQAFQYAEQGAIAYADDLLATFKEDGTYDDFLEGTIEPFKTDNGYCAVPTQLDMRVWWYRKSIFDEVGVSLPTTWDEYLTVGKQLAAKGYFAYGIGAGAGNNLGAHTMVAMMINNGGGLFNADNELDCVTDRNVEAMDFIRELVGSGIVDPAAVSYTTDNLTSQWKSGKIAMGINTPGLNDDLGDTTGDVLVATPMAGPHGDKGCLQFLNNIMMYQNTPSQESSEAFLQYWFKNYGTLWQQKLLPGLPVLKSVIALPEFQANTQKVEVINTWQPIAKTYAATGTEVDAKIAAIDGGQALNEFTQTMLSGKADSTAALTKLQSDISAL